MSGFHCVLSGFDGCLIRGCLCLSAEVGLDCVIQLLLASSAFFSKRHVARHIDLSLAKLGLGPLENPVCLLEACLTLVEGRLKRARIYLKEKRTFLGIRAIDMVLLQKICRRLGANLSVDDSVESCYSIPCDRDIPVHRFNNFDIRHACLSLLLFLAPRDKRRLRSNQCYRELQMTFPAAK